MEEASLDSKWVISVTYFTIGREDCVDESPQAVWLSQSGEMPLR
jgi:hypothetical protein